MTAQAMLTEARKSLGMGEPNKIQDWYADRNGSAYRYNFAWCDAAVTYWAHRSGNYTAVCPAGDRAYTVWHAQDFQKAGRWYPGTTANLNRAEPGDIVFFDWGGSDSIGRIDHIGVVEARLGDGRVQTIEGNTGNKCLRRVRSAATIAGYGRPAYSSAPPKPKPKPKPRPKPGTKAPAFPLPSGHWFGPVSANRRNHSGYWVSDRSHIKRIRDRLQERGWKSVNDGDRYDKTLADVIEKFQAEKRLSVDGLTGPATWRALWEAPIT